MLKLIPLQYNVRSLMGRKTTTIATSLGIGFVVFVIAAALMLANGLQKTLKASGSRSNGIVLRKGADGELSSSIDIHTVGLILSSPGVKKDGSGKPVGVGEIVVVVALEKDGEAGTISNVTVRGTSDMALAIRPQVHLVEGRPPQAGTDEVIIGKSLVGRFAGLEMGGSFPLKKSRLVHVVGVFEADGASYESEVWGDLDTVRTSFGRDTMVSSVTAALEKPSKYEGFAATVENDKQLGLDSMRETEYFEKQSSGMSGFLLGLGFSFAFLIGVGAIIGAMITMYGAVAQRAREIGTLRALGFSRFAILVSFLTESIFLALFGGVIGCLGALAMSFVHFSMVNFATWSEIVFKFTAAPDILLTALIAGVVTGLIGGFMPAIRAARMSPIAAMRD
jgi:putative ABC transport system permease protein